MSKRTSPPVGVGTLMYVGDDEIGPPSSTSSLKDKIMSPTGLKVLGSVGIAYGLTVGKRPLKKTALAGGVIALGMGLGWFWA